MARYAIIGLGRFGRKLARSLEEHGGEVIAIDRDEARVNMIKNDVTTAVTLDATDAKALKAAGLPKVRLAVVAIGDDFEANILTTLVLKEIETPRIVARTSRDTQSQILQMVGADVIVFPEEELAERMARSLVVESLEDVLPISENHVFAELRAPERFVGKSLAELNLRQEYGVNVVGLKIHREDEEDQLIETIPGPDTVIEETHVLLIVGPTEAIEKMAKL